MKIIRVKKQGRIGVIEGEIDSKLASALNNRLSYDREGWQFTQNKAWRKIRLYNKNKQRFPWGLKDKVKDILTQWKQATEEDYFIEEEKKFELTGYKSDILRDYQKEAIDKLIENNGGILNLPTGSGKTLTMIECLKMIRYEKAIVIVHSNDLKTQWKKELKKNGINNVTVMTYQYTMRRKYILKEYDIFIYDEVHKVAAKVLYDLALKSDGYIFGLSATPYRNYQPETLKMIAAVGEIGYKIKIRDLIEKGYLSDADIEIYNVKKIDINPWDSYKDIVNNGIVTNDDRNKMICDIAKKEGKKGTTLVLCERIEHGLLLEKSLVGENVIFVHGSSKNREKIFEEILDNKYNIVISTKIYQEGVNFPNLHTLILASGGKSAIATVQKIGRVLRIFLGKDRAKIIDFKDNTKYLDKHFNERLKIYKENFEVKFEDEIG